MTLPPSLKTLTEETRRGIFVRFASQTKRTRRGNVLLRRNPEYRFRSERMIHMSWMNVQGPKGNWMKARKEEYWGGGFGYFDPKSQPVHTLLKQPAGKVTPASFFTKIGKSPFGLR